MITGHEHINNTLSLADNIFCWDIGDEGVVLVYDNGKLVRISPFGGLAHKPISDVEKITYHYGLDAWEVIWKV